MGFQELLVGNLPEVGTPQTPQGQKLLCLGSSVPHLMYLFIWLFIHFLEYFLYKLAIQ